MTNLCVKYDWETRNSPMFGLKWFVREGAGDYLGRPDNQQSKTIWRYNQVNDLTGFGAVATFYGYPTRMAKLSNMTVSFGSMLIEVSNFRQNMSQYIGTDNDATATLSWNCGTGLAAPSANISSNCAACAKAMWNVADDKVKRLWPNNLPADNHECLLLKYFIKHPYSTLPRDVIPTTVFGNTDPPGSDTISPCICTLRRKLKSIGHANVITTIRGTGYRLSPGYIPRISLS